MILDYVYNNTFSRALIDTTSSIDPHELVPAELQTEPSNITPSVAHQFEKAENKKFSGASRNETENPICGRTIISEINRLKYVLIPFIIDALGQFNPCIYNFLDTKHSPYKHCDPNARSKTHLTHQPAEYALDHTRNPDCPHDLLLLADKKWQERTQHSHDTWFTSTYHATKPSDWARQTISFNCTMALATHFDQALRKLQRLEFQDTVPKRRKTPLTAVGADPNLPMTPANHYLYFKAVPLDQEHLPIDNDDVVTLPPWAT
jgi:hypothetical protein